MIQDLDERNQILTTIIWFDQEWYDERLVFDPEQFGGLDQIRVPCERLWLPDIVLYNNVEDQSITNHKALAWIHSDGKVFWPPIVKLKSSCRMDISFFPFDDQICFMTFGSWAWDMHKLNSTKMRSNVDIENLVDNGEWILVNTSVVEQKKRFPCCPEGEPFKLISFFLHLRRRNMYYTFNVILPCAILSCLTIVTFVLPPESGERVALGLTILLAYSVFMLLVAENMPPTSEFAPLIGIYLTVIMGLTSFSVVGSVLILNLHYRGRTMRRPPHYLIQFIEGWPRKLLCVVSPPDPTFICPVTYSTKGGLDQFEKQLRNNSRNYRNQLKRLSRRNSEKFCKIITDLPKFARDSNQLDEISLEIGGEEFAGKDFFLKYQDCTFIDEDINSPNTNTKNNEFKINTQGFSLPNGRISIPIYKCNPKEQCVKEQNCRNFDLLNSPKSLETENIVEDFASRSIKKFLHTEYEILCIKEWEYIAIFLDRMLLHLFVGILALSSLWLLHVKPMEKHLDLTQAVEVIT